MLVLVSPKFNAVFYVNQVLILTQDMDANVSGLETLKSFTTMNLASSVDKTT